MRIILDCNEASASLALMVAHDYLDNYPDSKVGVSVFGRDTPKELKFFFRRTKSGVSVKEFK